VLAPYPEPPIDRWEAEEAIRAATMTARGLDSESFEHIVLPRLRRLTRRQREVVFRFIDRTLPDGDRLRPSSDDL
jgi:predicted RNA-binding Zn ribbon-like protein